MRFTSVEVSTGDQVGYSFDPNLKQGNRYQLTFQYFNPYEPVTNPSVYIRVKQGQEVVWQYGLGEGAAVGWNTETIEFEPQQDGKALEFLMQVKEKPDQWEWGKHGRTMFRHIQIEPLLQRQEK